MIVTDLKEKAAVLLKRKRVPDNQEPSFRQFKSRRVYLGKRIRLVRFDKTRGESLRWYSDPESMKNIVGTAAVYNKKQIEEMYNWQNENGQLYYIEYLKDDEYQTIGDVWLAKDDYAIVIDQDFRSRHIGRTVTKYFIYKSRKMGRESMIVSEIFNWNKASQKMFTSLKFYPFKEHKNSWSYQKRLTVSEKQ
ncbi:GNAT family N-acetyltransferase [Enterococcus sp. BWT-B8]|uniref:GNAT family N-acetyltransferase n=1 Tax=Enterococcus sp. BWT-B8 TaxID=2885157 RepID=UPI001E440201|nr:GNAT family N-acetyltransferase [Enterococcus sp. BWT-B8]MCB5950785.1 GNAT family N-acetyltransferase [Enterococcus sp. BWT-B8]